MIKRKRPSRTTPVSEAPASTVCPLFGAGRGSVEQGSVEWLSRSVS